MKQHILRLLIVLILAVGIGLIIFFIVRDNTPFVVSNYVESQMKKDYNLKDNLEALNSKVNAKFGEDQVIYEIYQNNLKVYSQYISNLELEKEEANKVKSLFKDYRNKANTLENSTNSLIEYLNLNDANEVELLGRKEKVNTDFNALNKSFYKVCEKLESLVDAKIFKSENFNVYLSLNSCLNILTNCYNETRKDFSFVSTVNAKIKELKTHNANASEEAIKFVIKYNSLTKEQVRTDFLAYFEHGTVNENLNFLLNFLNSEVYYEEVN